MNNIDAAIGALRAFEQFGARFFTISDPKERAEYLCWWLQAHLDVPRERSTELMDPALVQTCSELIPLYNSPASVHKSKILDITLQPDKDIMIRVNNGQYLKVPYSMASKALIEYLGRMR